LLYLFSYICITNIFILQYPKAFSALFFVDKNNENLGGSGPWWKPGVEIFSEISSWIVVPIVLALIAGKALDSRYGTKPLWLLLLAGLAFIVSSYGIVRAVRNYARKIKNKKL
jgi:hypothetical protein